MKILITENQLDKVIYNYIEKELKKTKPIKIGNFLYFVIGDRNLSQMQKREDGKYYFCGIGRRFSEEIVNVFNVNSDRIYEKIKDATIKHFKNNILKKK